VVLGIDPGFRDAGVVAREGTRVLAHRTIHREVDEYGAGAVGVGPRYLAQLVGAVASMKAEFDPVHIAVEGVKRPNPHVKRQNGKSIIDPTHIIATAAGYGAILGVWPEAIVIPPGSNGSAVLGAYPEELVSPAERRGAGWVLRVGGGQLRHVRSAYDVAGLAFIHARVLASLQA
jgi:hypothetical protein